MSSPINMNLKRLKNQLNNSKNIVNERSFTKFKKPIQQTSELTNIIMICILLLIIFYILYKLYVYVNNDIEDEEPEGVSYTEGSPFHSTNNNQKYGPGYYSYSDDGMTKRYYNNVRNSERYKINQYIKKQNDYIRHINNRVREINKSRMYSPSFIRKNRRLQKVRNYERRLANQIAKDSQNEAFLYDYY